MGDLGDFADMAISDLGMVAGRAAESVTTPGWQCRLQVNTLIQGSHSRCLSSNAKGAASPGQESSASVPRNGH